MKEKDTLSLSIKRKYFDAILRGEQKREERTINPINESKFIERYDSKLTGLSFKSNVDYQKYFSTHDVKQPEDPMQREIYGMPIFVPYKKLKLITGAYNIKPRPYLIVEVESISFITYEDEENKPYFVKDVHDVKWLALTAVYHLGKVLEVHDKK